MNGTLQSAILTGSTCGFACWQAHEESCRCSCGGANHGILRMGGAQPQRTAKIDGQFYELVGIATDYSEVRETTREVIAERFPGLNTWAYGEYREERTMPILDRKISETQSRWPEVQAVAGARRLIWARPAGTRYLVKGENYKAVYNDHAAA